MGAYEIMFRGCTKSHRSVRTDARKCEDAVYSLPNSNTYFEKTSRRKQESEIATT